MGKIIDLTNELVSSASLRGRLTATTNGTSLDLQGYNGHVMAMLSSQAGTGTSPTLDVKLQDSADNSTFADVTGKTFTQVTSAAASHQEMDVDPRSVQRYVRLVATITGTAPVFDAFGGFVGGKKDI